MQIVPFNLLDSSFLNVELREEPLNIHVELQLEGRVDADRLRGSIEAACQSHPISRARIEPYGPGSITNNWIITDPLDADPLEISEASDSKSLADIRDRIVSEQPSAEASPAFRIHLVRGPESDFLITNLNHVIADGLSVFRLLSSILRHYNGEEDPLPGVDPLAVRDLKALAGSRSFKEAAKRLTTLVEQLVLAAEPPERMQGQGAAGNESGYGSLLLELTPRETGEFMSQRVKPATVNDMLIATMLLSIRTWNSRRDGSRRRISTMMPVNIRPSDWWFEVFGNFSTYVSINLPKNVPNDFQQAVRAVSKQTMKLKAAGASGTLIDLLDIPKFLPAILKARLKEITPTLGNNLIDSTWVSNLGRLGERPRMGDAGQVKAFYFSPPSPNPMGIALGISCVADQLYLAFRYRKSLLNRAAADEFARLFKMTMLQGYTGP